MDQIHQDSDLNLASKLPICSSLPYLHLGVVRHSLSIAVVNNN